MYYNMHIKRVFFFENIESVSFSKYIKMILQIRIFSVVDTVNYFQKEM